MAESGDVDELVHVFVSGAHVNARNKHGTTALMRAASHGHARMVRALLERGADPNLARNDKFTALALAAFFGHTEVVRILIEHGAKTDTVTRCGASAQTWAIRRTFADAASCLQARAAARAPRVVVPVPTPVAPVVKTLKDPPEIWDLVHEVPRDFTARSAFLSRLKSMKTSFGMRVAAVVVVSTACVVGVLVLRGSQARSLPVDPPAQQRVAASEVSAPVNVENTKTETPVAPSTTDVNNDLSHHSQPSSDNDKRSRKLLWTRQVRPRAAYSQGGEEEPVQTVQSTEAPAAAPEVASPKVEPPPRQSNKPNTGLSPQLVSPAKSTAPKAKVIQWP